MTTILCILQKSQIYLQGKCSHQCYYNWNMPILCDAGLILIMIVRGQIYRLLDWLFLASITIRIIIMTEMKVSCSEIMTIRTVLMTIQIVLSVSDKDYNHRHLLKSPKLRWHTSGILCYALPTSPEGKISGPDFLAS
uniref:Uncharacterized protein n=1 Tax=Nelumbo nucifera TaxID=4432 RepID=A0A822ZNM9_NELNU|nr:TPA_asm: hypothetical protein HUJ06_016444 [Nelumbo nucifera]